MASKMCLLQLVVGFPTSLVKLGMVLKMRGVVLNHSFLTHGTISKIHFHLLHRGFQTSLVKLGMV